MRNLLLLLMLGSYQVLLGQLYTPNAPTITNNATTNNVGIGVQNPASKLDVQADPGVSALRLQGGNPYGTYYLDVTPFLQQTPWTVGYNFNLKSSNGSFSNFMTLIDGKVGYGTTAPTQRVEVAGNVLLNAENSALGIDAQVNPRLGFVKKSGQYPMMVSTSGAPIIFSQTNQTDLFNNISEATLTERMRINSDGNIGIGNTNPTSQFEINGGVERTSLGKVPPQYRQALGWASQYIGFNISREPQGWSTYSDGFNNGASMILADPFGTMRIVNISSTGSGSRYLNEDQINQNTKFIISPSGNVGVGTIALDAKLTVKGTVHASEIKVDLNVQGPDYVFEPTYALTSLDSVQSYINQNKHLPEVPSAKEMEANGVNVGEMNMLLLKKVEELTLYMLQQQKQIQLQQDEITEMKQQMKKIKVDN